jgi:kumamolisin
MRNVPDVAYPVNNDSVYLGGSWISLNGTSWATPIFVSALIEMEQMKATRFGYVNPALYSVLASPNAYATDFDDITTGGNQAYNAGPGYDDVTGLGSPFGWESGQALQAPVNASRTVKR